MEIIVRSRLICDQYLASKGYLHPYGLEVFHRFFEHIIALCIQARLVWGEELYFDGTKVRSNADIDGMVDKVEREAHQHLEQLFPKEQDGNSKNDSPFVELVAKYNGERITGTRKPTYKRIAKEVGGSNHFW